MGFPPCYWAAAAATAALSNSACIFFLSFRFARLLTPSFFDVFCGVAIAELTEEEDDSGCLVVVELG